MAEVTSLAIPADATPQYAEDRLTPIVWSATVTSGIAASADTLRIATLPVGARVIIADLAQDGSLGASCTAQIRHNGTAITSATGAGSANAVRQTAIARPATTATIVDILVGGAAIAASANLQVTLAYVV